MYAFNYERPTALADAQKLAEAYLSGYEAAETALTAPEALKKLLNKGV